jgi:hypothetical protein
MLRLLNSQLDETRWVYLLLNLLSVCPGIVDDMRRVKPTRCYTVVYWTLWFAQHVSGIIMPIIRSSRLYRWPQRVAPHLGYGRLLVWCMAVGFERPVTGMLHDSTRYYTMVYWTLWIAQHVSGIIMPIIRSLRLYRRPRRVAPHLSYGRLLVWCMAVGFERPVTGKLHYSTRYYTMVYSTLWIAQHVSGIIMPVIRSLRLYRWPQRVAPHLGYGRLLVLCMAVGLSVRVEGCCKIEPYDSLNMFRALLCPSSGACGYTDGHSVWHLTLVMAGCWSGAWL